MSPCAARACDRLLLLPGVYPGPVTLSKSVTLWARRGAGPAIIDGGGRGRAVEIAAAGVTLDGLTMRNSGDDIESKDACIYVRESAARVNLTGNSLRGCLFGIWVHGAPGARVEENRISGLFKPLVSDRGNGIQLWNVREALVRRNLIREMRDGIYLSVTTESRIASNVMSGVRFGIHYMYNDHNEIVHNVTCNSVVGQAMMYSKRLQIRGNLALDNTEHGILFRSIFDSVIAGNRVEGNGKGFFLNDSSRNVITGNRVSGNRIGVHVTAGSDENTVYGNDFAANPVQVQYAWQRPMTWDDGGRGNYWSDYLGWDMNGDGVGDRSYYASNRIDALMYRYPQVRLLAFSPALQVLQALEARFPVLRPPTIVDRYPAMRPFAGSVRLDHRPDLPAEAVQSCRETRKREGSPQP